jgi:glycosyltransferase involved in cell wall biosynthesis
LNHRRIRALVKRHRPDVLHANNGGYPGGESVRLAPIAAAREGVPSVQFVHNMAYPPAIPARVELALDAAVDRSVHSWLTAAARASDALASVRRISRAKVRTVHYGVPPISRGESEPDRGARAELGFPEGVVGILVVASFEPRKGHRVLLDAVARIEEARRPHLAFVGVGETRGAVEREVRERGLADWIRFLGWREDVGRLMAASEVLALPSISHECLPYAILEAMSHGKPVVSTDVAGIPEIVRHGVTGLVVPPGHADELARALERLVADPAERLRMGEAGRERAAAQFAVADMTATVEALWRDAAVRR